MTLSNERIVTIILAVASALGAGGSGFLATDSALESDKRAACGEALVVLAESYAVALQQERARNSE